MHGQQNIKILKVAFSNKSWFIVSLFMNHLKINKLKPAISVTKIRLVRLLKICLNTISSLSLYGQNFIR